MIDRSKLVTTDDVRLAALEWADAATAYGDPVPAPPHASPMAAE